MLGKGHDSYKSTYIGFDSLKKIHDFRSTFWSLLNHFWNPFRYPNGSTSTTPHLCFRCVVQIGSQREAKWGPRWPSRCPGRLKGYPEQA